MQQKKWYAAMAAALLLATGCSDDLENGKDSGGSEENGNGVYMTVNVSTVSQGIGTKSESGDTNEDVTSNPGGAGWGEDGNGFLEEMPNTTEGWVYDVNVFLVPTTETSLDGNNQLNLLNSTKEQPIVGQGFINLDARNDAFDGSVGDGEFNHGNSNRIIKITMTEPLKQTPENYQVFTVVNAGEMKKYTSLTALREDVSVLSIREDNSTKKFIMSTHKMISNNGNPPSIVSLSINNTESNPAKTSVYVERLAARVDLANNKTNSTWKGVTETTSPVYNQGTFALNGYAIVNQWKGNNYLFKQVSPVVNANFGANAVLPGENVAYAENDPKRYLGNEVWTRTNVETGAGKYNYVLDTEIRNKTQENINNYSSSYINWFNSANKNALNDVASTIKSLPEVDAPNYTQTGNSKVYYPVAYINENTLNLNAQVHGYTTGVIFQTKFTPNESFKVSKYADGKIEEVELDQTNGEFSFFTAVHFNGSESSRVVYNDLMSVVAGAFNIKSDSDTHGLLKGFMDGSDFTNNATLDDVKKAINTISVSSNKLAVLFKNYLNETIGDATELTSEIKGKLNYEAFVETQEDKTIFSASSLSTDQIGTLYETYEVSFYKNGESYHKFWIRHEDNGNDNVMGVMEFGIVRNNVYQLYVSGVRDLGDPLPYTPGKDDPNTDDEENKITIDVTLYVKDWVKRTNKDIIL